MSTDQIIALLASIGACLTAISSFIVLRQNNKQREQSYKPQLILKNIKFFSTESKNDLPSLKNWNYRDIYNYNHPLSLPISNIGLGAAKQIKALWSFNFETFISKINNEAQKSLVSAYFEFNNKWLNLISNTFPAYNFNWANEKHQEFDYIIPIANTNEVSNLIIPESIIYLYIFYVYVLSKKMDKNNFIDFPMPKIELSYFDIGNKIHKEQFAIKINLISFETRENSLQSLSGFIETVSLNK